MKTLTKEQIIEKYKEKYSSDIIHPYQLTIHELQMLDFCIEYFASELSDSELGVGTAEEWFDENQANYKGIKSRHYAIQMLKDFTSQFQQKAQQPITDEILGNDKSWPLKDVLDKLIEASEILLHEKNYDRHGWEEISHCVKRGKEIVSILVHKAQLGDNKEISPYLLSKDEIEETIKKRNQGYK